MMPRGMRCCILRLMWGPCCAGMFNCPHTGVALAALTKLREKKVIGPNDKTVVVSTAHGLKFTASKVAYHSKEIQGFEHTHANPPTPVANDVDQVLRVIHERMN